MIIFGHSNKAERLREDDLKVFALSEIIREGTPLRAQNLRKFLKNASVDISGTRSRCTARVLELHSMSTLKSISWNQGSSQIAVQ